jgi:hypothetical protein
MTLSQWFAVVGELGEANIQVFRLANLWRHIYGPAFLLLVVFGNGDIWGKMNDLLNKEASEKTSEDACEEFKESERKECKMACLAVSIPRLPQFAKLLAKNFLSQGTIIALIAITSLLLPSLEQAHWVARAFWIFSLLTSCFSAHHACNLRRALSRLKKCDIKIWMTDSLRSKDNCELPCVLAVIMISCPKQLLRYALPAYIIGLGVYLGSLWHYQLDTAVGHNDSRNIFIVFLVSVPFCYLYSQFAKLKDMGYWKMEIDTLKSKP